MLEWPFTRVDKLIYLIRLLRISEASILEIFPRHLQWLVDIKTILNGHCHKYCPLPNGLMKHIYYQVVAYCHVLLTCSISRCYLSSFHLYTIHYYFPRIYILLSRMLLCFNNQFEFVYLTLLLEICFIMIMKRKLFLLLVVYEYYGYHRSYFECYFSRKPCRHSLFSCFHLF